MALSRVEAAEVRAEEAGAALQTLSAEAEAAREGERVALSRVEAAERWAAEAGTALQASQEVIRNALATAAEAEARAEAAEAIAAATESGEDGRAVEIDRLREQVQQEKQDHQVGALTDLEDLDPVAVQSICNSFTHSCPH